MILEVSYENEETNRINSAAFRGATLRAELLELSKFL